MQLRFDGGIDQRVANVLRRWTGWTPRDKQRRLTMTFFLGQLNTSHRGRRHQQSLRPPGTYPREVLQNWDGLTLLGVNPRTLRIGRRTRERMMAEASAYAESSRAERAEILSHLVREVGSAVPWTHSFNCFTSDEGALGRCDFASYLYFSLSAMLFTVGALVTVFGFLNYTPVFNSRDRAFPEHVWLVGPIFVCSGLLVGCKTVLHMRRKKMLYQVLRLQNIINWELQNERRIDRNPSVLTLPPPYDIALAMPTTNPLVASAPGSRNLASSSGPAGNGGEDVEMGDEVDAFLAPPSYDEALRLLAQLKDESVPMVEATPAGVRIRFPDSDRMLRGEHEITTDCTAPIAAVSSDLQNNETSTFNPTIPVEAAGKEGKAGTSTDVP